MDIKKAKLLLVLFFLYLLWKHKQMDCTQIYKAITNWSK